MIITQVILIFIFTTSFLHIFNCYLLQLHFALISQSVNTKNFYTDFDLIEECRDLLWKCFAVLVVEKKEFLSLIGRALYLYPLYKLYKFNVFYKTIKNNTISLYIDWIFYF